MAMNSLIRRSPHGHFTIRELRTCDAQACDVFFHHLDQQDIRWRFASRHFSIHYILPGVARASEGVAFAALDAGDTILGVVNLEYLGPGSAEVAVIVRSDYKRRGIGRSLLEHAIQWSEDKGLSQVIGYVLVGNTAMLALACRMGFQSVRWDSFFFEVRWLASAQTKRLAP